jgi:hypothetical protein
MMAERLHSRALVTHDRLPRNRRLRNRIIVANAMVGCDHHPDRPVPYVGDVMD